MFLILLFIFCHSFMYSAQQSEDYTVGIMLERKEDIPFSVYQRFVAHKKDEMIRIGVEGAYVDENDNFVFVVSVEKEKQFLSLINKSAYCKKITR